MQIYNKYVVTRRYKKLAQCGNVNIPYGTECNVVNSHITCDRELFALLQVKMPLIIFHKMMMVMVLKGVV